MAYSEPEDWQLDSEAHMDRPNSRRFLDPFVAVEEALGNLTGMPSYTPFRAKLRKAAERRADVRHFQDDLNRYADLRNVIVHERHERTEVIAEPHEGVVTELERISKLLQAPPRLEQLEGTKVQTCTPDNSVLAVTKVMYEGRFSQMPVYNDDECVGLVTSETIARWLTVKLDEEGGVLDDSPVSEVLPYREGSSVHRFMARTDTVSDAISAFHRLAAEGKYLDAIIVTATGDATQSPLDILTVFDLPRLHRRAEGR